MTIKGRDVFTGTCIELETSGAQIARVEAAAEDAGLPWVSPGFFDAQVNGWRGDDYSGDGSMAQVARRVTDALAASGTTRHLATIVTAPAARILQSVGELAAAIGGSEDLAAAIPGFHVEGPFISAEDGPRGAHDRAWVRDPDAGELREWHAAAAGRLSLVTLAPERRGAVAFVEKARELGVVVAIGHTAADADAIARAVDAGARLSTHLGNGSHPLLPRLRNYLWEQLACDRLAASLIADGFHLPDPVMRVFAKAKGLERLLLVSDAAPCAGLAPGRHRWGGIEVEVHADGHLGLAGTSMLAGAGHMLDQGLARFMAATGAGLAQAVPLATSQPAALFGLPGARAALAPGEPADLAVFEYNGREPRLRVLQTVRGGRAVWTAA